MKPKSILMNGEMVRAILDGRKSQTRRPIKHDFSPHCFYEGFVGNGLYQWYNSRGGIVHKHRCPFGGVGQLLYVREAHAYPVTILGAPNYLRMADGEPVIYRADGTENPSDNGYTKWRPSIHMPRWASRITLRVTRTWAQRVQDTSIEDIAREGLKPWDEYSGPFTNAGKMALCENAFAELWDSIYAKRGLGWDVNLWVFGCEFERVSE